MSTVVLLVGQIADNDGKLFQDRCTTTRHYHNFFQVFSHLLHSTKLLTRWKRPVLLFRNEWKAASVQQEEPDLKLSARSLPSDNED